MSVYMHVYVETGNMHTEFSIAPVEMSFCAFSICSHGSDAAILPFASEILSLAMLICDLMEGVFMSR